MNSSEKDVPISFSHPKFKQKTQNLGALSGMSSFAMIAFSEPNQIVEETIVLLGLIWKRSNYLTFSMGISRARPSTLTKLATPSSASTRMFLGSPNYQTMKFCFMVCKIPTKYIPILFE
ncbi:hypothetical protein [Brucella pituitosa]|uniref:Uncharacterized protein n=1 Tax=Brucella pituitosa TaxID=571256 RepID=A0A643F5D8_9HYPH|nr:hypothetical protein [Brucella pituitosa]KAB0573363.1 hypothetical protein F7Q93_02405 [Brucella pituitosa]